MAIPASVYQQAWEAYRAGIPYDESLALCAYWRAHYRELGAPVDAEFTAADGRTYQTFVNGILVWTGSAVEVVA